MMRYATGCAHIPRFEGELAVIQVPDWPVGGVGALNPNRQANMTGSKAEEFHPLHPVNRARTATE